jgi:peptidoglycan/LPS O-acetylase OafA/YrhL
MSFFYVYNFVPNAYYSGELGHTWSLAIEEQFYLIWPFLLGFVRSRRSLAWVLGGIIGLCLISIYLLPQIEAFDHFKVRRWFIPAAGPIVIGSAVAMWYHWQGSLWNKKWFQSRRLMLLALILFISPLYLPRPLLGASFMVTALGVAMFLVWVIHNQSNSLVNRLESRPLSYIGRISYGLYVYQGLFLTTGPTEDGMFIQRFPWNLLLLVLVAPISYKFLEKPALRIKDRFRQKERKTPSDSLRSE